MTAGGQRVGEQSTSEYVVERTVLKERMSAALTVPLTLLVAQAGAGKTVLLQQWAAEHPTIEFIWLDIEAADDDPVRFARRLLSELSSDRPGAAHLAHLASLGAGALGSTLLRDLSAELRSSPELVIVLDDLHHLSNATLLADIGRFISDAPPNVHVVISTRVDPPIAWSRLRLRGRLLEIRQADLAMTSEEASELLVRLTGRDVQPDMLEVLVDRTDGWAAGLQLAGLTLRFHSSPGEFVAEFSGTDRLIAEYLTEEVLEAVPDGDRALLLRMSVFDSMTAGLVNHALERSDAERLFERLERESMFFVALDSRREHFRFHHLFRDLLRYRLKADDADVEPRLLARAADYHLGRGEPVPAVEYLLRARAWDRALDVIMTGGSEVFERGEMGTVIRWITTVPEEVRARRVDVALELGMLVGMQGEAARAVDLMSRAVSSPEATIGQHMIAEAWSSATAQWSTRPEHSIRAAERALALLEAHPEAEIPDVMHLTTRDLLVAVALVSGGRAHFLAGDFVQAEAWLTRALESEGSVYPPVRVGVLGSLALLHIWCGRARDAELLAAEALQTAAETRLLMHPDIADAYLAEALVAHERGSPDAAAPALHDGTLRAEANHRTQLAWIGRYERALLAAADGRFEEALESVDLSRHDAISAPAPAILDRLVAVRSSVLRRSGHAEEAVRARGELLPASAAGCFEAVAAALTVGDQESAGEILAAADDTFAAEGTRGAIQRSLLMAWAAEIAGDHRIALDFAGSALDRAEPEGLVEIFLDAGPVILAMVEELSQVRNGLTNAIRSRRGDAGSSGANSSLPEPLTVRELEILAVLPSHSTTAELAGLFFVSANTLKTHIAHIYRKLAVSGRSAAIVRARELGLLDPITPSDRAHG